MAGDQHLIAHTIAGDEVITTFELQPALPVGDQLRAASAFLTHLVKEDRGAWVPQMRFDGFILNL